VMTRFLIAAAALLALSASRATAQPSDTADHKHQHATADTEHKHHHAAGATAKAAKIESAVCILLPVGDSHVSGVVRFTQGHEVVQIRGKVTGLKPGKHAFHVHEFGDLTSMKDGMSAGSHFNPTHQPHGAPGDKERHAGDFGNIEADENGVAEISLDDPVIQLNGPNSIIGRSLVIHVDSDKFTQPVGNAGARVTVGVIGVAKPETSAAK
jgi:superoxide dismutase, Cu-Zn family